MQDVTYTELIILEYRDQTELADAKYDDRINMQDVTQIELVILGKEKELTLIDAADRAVTVNKPIEGGIIAFGTYTPEILRILGEEDKIVAVNKYVKSNEVYFPELSKLPSIGSSYSPDLEVVASLNPELVLAWTTKPEGIAALVEIVPDDCSVVSLMFYRPEDMVEETEKLAYILGKRDEAKYYIDDFHNEYVNLIKARTEDLSDGERPNVYVESDRGDKYQTWAAGSAANGFIEIAGGRNIFADTPGAGSITVDPEEVVEKNPDIIIRYIDAADAGYEVDDPSKMETLWARVMSRPELTNVKAVKNGAVYVMDKDPIYGPDYPVAIAYWAKWSHPDLFGDLDLQAIHQQYIDIQGLDINLDEHGVFVYPPLEGS
jgi:iron complex transport system substrate-binding protein